MAFNNRHNFGLTLAALTLSCVIASSHAQTLTEQGFRPVDTRVEDQDPLGRSFRVIEPGLATTGERTSVYQRILPGGRGYERPRTQRLFFIAQGFMAEYDRSQYVANQRGDIFAAIPADTIFHIAPPREPFTAEPEELGVDQVDGRIDGHTTDTRPTGNHSAVRDTQWERYNTAVLTQRAVVVQHLRRPADEP